MKKILYTTIFLGLSLLTSCDKFLDVKPAKEVKSDDLLSDIKGYESALAGIYYSMSSNTLYGGDLQFGLIDALVGYWDISPSDHKYSKLSNNDYTTNRAALGYIWNNMYTIIFNANNIINTLEKKSSLTEMEKLVLGEAIGIRAYLHLELFRLYGPVIKEEGLETKAIPYRKSANAVITPLLTSTEVFKAIEQDLLRAEEFLKKDPILENGGVANGNSTNGIDYSSLLDRRRDRFNAVAVQALFARLYQLMGNHEKIQQYALATLEKTSATFVTPADLNLSVTTDTRLTKEIIFGLYIRDHYEYTRGVFGIDGADVAVNSSLYVNYDFKQSFVYGELGDYRLNRWFQPYLSYTVFTRFAKPPLAQDAFLAYRPEVSLISLTEIHLMLAESYAKTDVIKSTEYLNQLRKVRGITIMLDPVNMNEGLLIDEILKEARRQYFGEGQLFYLFKRLNKDIVKSPTHKVPASLGVFKLPIPEKEFDFNN